MVAFTDHAKALAERNRKLATELESGNHVARLGPIIEAIKQGFRGSATIRRQNDGANFMEGDCRQPVRDAVGRVWQESEQVLENLLAGLERNLGEANILDVGKITSELSAVATEFKNVLLYQKMAIRQNRWLSLRVKLESMFDWTRLAGISIFVPIIMLFIATAHYLGSVGFAIMGSPIMFVISSLR